MTLDFGRVLADAWRVARRDHAVLVPVAGLFLFLPQFAQLLLLPPMPVLPPEVTTPDQVAAWIQGSFSVWASAYGWWIVAGYACTIFGSVAVLAWLLGRPDETLGTLLLRAAALAWRYLLISVLTGLPIGLGVFSPLLLVPAIYLLGRLMLAGPAIVARPGTSAIAALSRSWRVTKGRGIVLSGLAALGLLGGIVATAPFLAIGRWVESNGSNPVAMAMVDGGAAFAATVASLALLLIQATVWRTLSENR